jgi:hypothetical protein
MFVYEGFEPVDVFGFAEAFTIARFVGASYRDPRPYTFAVTLIGRHVAFRANPAGWPVPAQYFSTCRAGAKHASLFRSTLLS